jgi:hypothetical protein
VFLGDGGEILARFDAGLQFLTIFLAPSLFTRMWRALAFFIMFSFRLISASARCGRRAAAVGSWLQHTTFPETG